MTKEIEAPCDDVIPWEDVSAAAAGMFNVWFGGSELEWAKECWSHFTKAGLTGNLSILEDTESRMRLLTLARIYHEFSWIAWEEDPETPIEYLAENLDLNDIAIGVLATKAQNCDINDEYDEDELRSTALTYASDAQRPEIFKCLVLAYGGEVPLYSAMSKTNETSDEGREFEASMSNSNALDYVTSGFGTG